MKKGKYSEIVEIYTLSEGNSVTEIEEATHSGHEYLSDKILYACQFSVFIGTKDCLAINALRFMSFYKNIR